jgi:hypothetical protein
MSEVTIDINKYKELQKKYNKVKKENKILKETLNSYTKNIEVFQKSYNSITSMFNEMSETVKNLQANNVMTNVKQDKALSSLSNQNNNNTSMKNLTASERMSKLATAPQSEEASNCPVSSEQQMFFSKKLDDLESYSTEMALSFSNLVVKYKILKDEKEKIEKERNIINEESQSMRQDFYNLNELLKEKENIISNLKERVNALLDANLGALSLSLKNEDNNIGEPMPSFISFLKKY